MIKLLKIKNQILINFEEKIVDENGQEMWNIPEDLQEFKTIAIDTFNYLIGREVLKSSGGKQVDLSASNSKAVVLNAKILDKVVEHIGLDLSNFLTDLENQSFNLEVQLSQNGYSDSKKLKNTLFSVVDNISRYTDKIIRVNKAKTHQEIIDILNEDY